MVKNIDTGPNSRLHVPKYCRFWSNTEFQKQGIPKHINEDGAAAVGSISEIFLNNLVRPSDIKIDVEIDCLNSADF